MRFVMNSTPRVGEEPWPRLVSAFSPLAVQRSSPPRFPWRVCRLGSRSTAIERMRRLWSER